MSKVLNTYSNLSLNKNDELDEQGHIQNDFTKKKKMNTSMTSRLRENTIYTQDGHKLTNKESIFIEEYLKTGNASEAVLDAGYNAKVPSRKEILKLAGIGKGSIYA